MTPHRLILKNYLPLQSHVCLGDGSLFKAIGYGDVQIGGMMLESVIHIPNMTVNLLSVSRLLESGIGRTLTFQPSGGKLIQDSKVCHRFITKDNLYYLLGSEDIRAYVAFCLTEDKTDAMIKWHQRMGHIGETPLKKLGIERTLPHCKTCLQEKKSEKPNSI
jgi:hypothetical protein